MNAVLGHEDLVHREHHVRVRIGHDLQRPGIRAGQGDLLVRQKLRGFDADSRRARGIAVIVFHPQLAPGRC